MIVKGTSIDDFDPRGEGGGLPSKQMKDDENRYLFLAKQTSFCHESNLWLTKTTFMLTKRLI